MKTHIRFHQSFASYSQGQSYRLPNELADMYVKAGVASVVDSVPDLSVQSEAEPLTRAPLNEVLTSESSEKPKSRKRKTEVTDVDDAESPADPAADVE